ncbi:hypothetical protein [uncultured Fusobacterium sp.]|uniref:hypothetical protein n=1 Tax=uncultured Fusobacterium sp. TaxID=159267 RepID=UPI0015A65586|nr:hypothetical protein [uncultured Fusobacterium sp.]
MKRKLLLFFTIIFLSFSLFASKNDTVIRTFKRKFPQDNFYFIQGLDYKFDITTNIRYRGILYSDRLEKLNYPFGLELALEANSDGYEYLETYEGLFLKLQVDKPIEDKMKEIFGPKSVLNNNFYPAKKGYYGMLKKMWKKIPFEDKGRADYTVVNLFVNRLEDIDKELMKKKTYEFAKFMQDEINLKTYLQVYIRDNTFFENYNLVAYQVYPPFREREDIKKILGKIKSGKKITEQEKIALTNVFYKSISFKCPTVDFLLFFNKNPLGKYENAELYFRDTENILNYRSCYGKKLFK